jgi:hypothetical protein
MYIGRGRDLNSFRIPSATLASWSHSHLSPQNDDRRGGSQAATAQFGRADRGEFKYNGSNQ